MTTICTDGKTVAADRLISDNNLTHGQICKVTRLTNGAVMAYTGSPYQLPAFVEWLNGDQSSKFESDSVSEAIVLMPDGTIRMYDEHGRWYEADAPQAAGSGAAVAYGALAAGASPAEAIEIASRYDIKTGGGVDTCGLIGSGITMGVWPSDILDR